MRVSVTLSDETNKLIAEHAKNKGISKDKLIAGIVEDWLCTPKNDCNSVPKHNERGAGRKARFSYSEVVKIKDMRAKGMSIRSIAKMFNCSAGLVHKIINEQDYNANQDVQVSFLD